MCVKVLGNIWTCDYDQDDRYKSLYSLPSDFSSTEIKITAKVISTDHVVVFWLCSQTHALLFTGPEEGRSQLRSRYVEHWMYHVHSACRYVHFTCRYVHFLVGMYTLLVGMYTLLVGIHNFSLVCS